MGREENILLGCVVYTKIKEKNQGEGQSENVWECCCEMCSGELTQSLPTTSNAQILKETEPMNNIYQDVTGAGFCCTIDLMVLYATECQMET